MQGAHSTAGADAGRSFGSPAADQAVQKLEALGAKVYPPESKDVMDWGILAGECFAQPSLPTGPTPQLS